MKAQGFQRWVRCSPQHRMALTAESMTMCGWSAPIRRCGMPTSQI